MDDLTTHYRELDLAPGAGLNDVKASYRKLAKVWHPDRFTHDPDLQSFANAKLAKINTSYAFLIRCLQTDRPPGFDSTQTDEESNFAKQPPLAKCPVCGRWVFEGSTSYACEGTEAVTNKCGFKVGRTILQRPIEPQQLAKLLKLGRTDLLKGFVSRTGNTFNAYLVLAAGGKIEFELPTPPQAPPSPRPEAKRTTPGSSQSGRPTSALFDEGLRHLSAGKLKPAGVAFQKAAEAGDPRGCYAMAYMLTRHTLVWWWDWPSHHRKVFNHLLKAAEHGITEAEFIVGTYYACGQGTKLDKQQANSWLQKAASKGHSEAAKWLKMDFLRALNSVPLLWLMPVANWFVPDPPPPAHPSSVTLR
jgi:hypothetical protein